MDREAVRREWQDRGFSCDIWTDSPGQIWADFTHPTDELVMLIEGELELKFMGRTIIAEIGEEVLIPAGESHTVTNIGDCQNYWFYGYKKA